LTPPTEENSSQLTYWQNLANAVDSGNLYLNPTAAKKCNTLCAEYLARLDIHRKRAFELANVHGYGDFDSGKQLADMFSEKAVGGEDNMVDVLDSHIQVVKEMQAVFQKLFTATDDTDQSNSTAIGQVGPK
jgi:hypothetical protein